MERIPSLPSPTQSTPRPKLFRPAESPGRLHLVVVAVLLVAVLSVAGLALAGRTYFAPPAKTTTPATPEKKETQPATADERPAGRYRIEKMDEARDLIERTGKLRFFDGGLQDVWVFRYSGGYLQVQLDAEFAGAVATSGPMPEDWKPILTDDRAVSEQRVAPLKSGYIVLAAMQPLMTVEQALVPYHPHLGCLLSAGTAGPLHALPALHLDVHLRRPYRLFLSASPPDKAASGGFNLWENQELPIVTRLVPRPRDEEEYHIGGGKDLKPEQDVLLVERQRGSSRIRLKARFLGEGKMQALLGK